MSFLFGKKNKQQQQQQQSYAHQGPAQMPEAEHYAAYPGQPTFQNSGAMEQGQGNGYGNQYSSNDSGYGADGRSPISPPSASRGTAPISQYPTQYRPSRSPIPEPERVVQQPGPGQFSPVERRPVNGSWRDV